MRAEADLEKAQLEAYRQGFQRREAQRAAEREQLRQERLARVREKWPALLAGFPTLSQAYLYGSILKESLFRPDSDIDVAVVGLAPESFSPLWDVLEASMPEHVIDLRPLQPETFFGQQVQARGMLLYERKD